MFLLRVMSMYIVLHILKCAFTHILVETTPGLHTLTLAQVREGVVYGGIRIVAHRSASTQVRSPWGPFGGVSHCREM